MPDFDDSRWERVTYDFGPQFWVLGPVPADAANDALDAELAKLTQVESATNRSPWPASRFAGGPTASPGDMGSKAIQATRAGTA